jgi:hypothetical protein
MTMFTAKAKGFIPGVFLREDICRSERRRVFRRIIGVITLLISGVTAFITESHVRAHTPMSQVTWTLDIAPIIRARCERCHAADGFAPLPLTSYQEVRASAKAIRGEVLSGRMPPWPAARGYGDFANDASLSPLELELLTSWVDGGTPLGAATPSTTHDAPISSSRSLHFDLPEITVSGGTLERFEIPTAEKLERWVTGWEFVPGNHSLVEEVTLRIAPATYIGSWTPLEPAILFRAGSAQRLPRQSRLLVEVRYKKTSDPQTDRSRLTLQLGSKPAAEIHHQLFGCGTTRLTSAVDVLAVRPHAAGAGDSIEVVAREPSSAIRPIVVVPFYRPGYPATYRFRTAERLPAGTTLTVRSSARECSADVDFLMR